MRSFKTEAIIIKRKNIGESDKLITVFTRKFGKIRIKAVGVRKINSRRSPHVELLNLSTLSFYKGKAMPVLIEAEAINSFSSIKKDLKKVAYAYYVCELIDSLCPDGQETGSIFSLFENVLNDISKNSNTLNLINCFERDLLTALGYLNKKANSSEIEDLSAVVEQIIERKLKTKQILPRLI